jgi:hypothetical protein
MTTDKDTLMFANIRPGQPGYCYTAEGEAECIRLVVRDGSGNLWTDRGHGGEPLARAVDDVLDLVPTRATYQALQAALYDKPPLRADAVRVRELEATVEYLRAQLRTCKRALAALCEEEP